MATLTANQIAIPSGSPSGGDQDMISFDGMELNNSTKKVTVNLNGVSTGDFAVMGTTPATPVLFTEVSTGNTSIGESGTSAQQRLTIKGTDDNNLYFRRSDGVTTSGEQLGKINFDTGDSESTVDASAQIVSLATTAHTATEKGADLRFYTKSNTTGSADAATLWLTIDENGKLISEKGILHLKESSTPTAKTNYGALYFKNDNKLYAQDGAGTEHEVAFV